MKSAEIDDATIKAIWQIASWAYEARLVSTPRQPDDDTIDAVWVLVEHLMASSVLDSKVEDALRTVFDWLHAYSTYGEQKCITDYVARGGVLRRPNEGDGAA